MDFKDKYYGRLRVVVFPSSTPAGRCVARLVIAALAALRHENLCIIRARVLSSATGVTAAF